MYSAPTPRIYLGTGGYSDTDLLGTLYPTGTKKTDFLREYAKQYGAVEINSTFYAPIGQKAFAGMVNKAYAEANSELKFAVKLHQDFTHARKGTAEHAQAFLNCAIPTYRSQCFSATTTTIPTRL